MNIIYKNSEEIQILAEGGMILSNIVNQAKKAVKSGVTKQEIHQHIEDLLVKNKVKSSFLGYHGFPAVACISINEEVVHGISSSREVRNGDLVKIDMGIWYKSLCTDMTEMVLVGEVSADTKRLAAAVQKALKEAIKKCYVGNKIKDISRAIEEIAKEYQVTPVRDLFGHGVGKNVHEDPFVPNFYLPGQSSEVELKLGMVLAIEPIFNLGDYQIKLAKDKSTYLTADGLLSAHYEKTIAITKDGPLVLTP